MHLRFVYVAAVALALALVHLASATSAVAAERTARYRLTFRTHFIQPWDGVDLRISDAYARDTWKLTLLVAGEPYPAAVVDADHGGIRFLWALPHGGAERRFEVRAVDLDHRAVVAAHVHRTWYPPRFTDAGKVTARRAAWRDARRSGRSSTRET